MKKYLLFLFTWFAINNSGAQSITSFSIIPSNPTPTDTIKILAECMFPSGPCDGAAMITHTSGDTLFADALHCMGMLTVICTDFDTLIIPPLPAGNYSLVFTLTAGNGFPCTPGIVVDDVDTLNFSVEQITGVEQPEQNIFRIFPNPSDGMLRIANISNDKFSAQIFSSKGTLIRTLEINHNDPTLEMELPPGVYYIKVSSDKSNYQSKFIIY